MLEVDLTHLGEAALFKAWRKRMGFTQLEAARALGISRDTIFNYEQGIRRDSGKVVVIPRAIKIACVKIEEAFSSPMNLELPKIKPSEIPISAAEAIAKTYGYDQVVIYARKVTTEENAGGEHITTYGVNKVHCGIAARIGETLKKFMGWNT